MFSHFRSHALFPRDSHACCCVVRFIARLSLLRAAVLIGKEGRKQQMQPLFFCRVRSRSKSKHVRIIKSTVVCSILLGRYTSSFLDASWRADVGKWFERCYSAASSTICPRPFDLNFLTLICHALRARASFIGKEAVL